MSRLSSRTSRILRRVGTTALAVALVLAVLVMGIWIGGHPRQSGLDRAPSAIRDRLVEPERTSAATQVLSILATDYYRELPESKLATMEDDSVRAMVAAVGDPYTTYMSKDEFAEYLNSRAGTYVGIGIEWRVEDAQATVVRVTAGGPAAKAGLKPDDVILAVDGKPVTAKDHYAAMDTVKGDPDTKVVIRIKRGADVANHTMTRAEIHEQVVDSRIETVDGKKVGVVRLDRFTTGSAKEVRRAVESQAESKVAAIVLDVRSNPGGLVDEAQDIVGIFVPRGTTVATTKHRDGPRESIVTDATPVTETIPVVVLMNGYSASASEIVAGALRDRRSAKLVGTQTFGKALIQTTRRLSNEGALKYTTASYLTPEGFDLGKRGLPPDVTVKDNPTTPADDQLQRALKEAVGS